MVIGSYNKDYNENSDQDYRKAESEITAAEARIDKLRRELKELEELKGDLSKQRDKYNEELIKGKATQDLAKERQEKLADIDKSEAARRRYAEAIAKHFGKDAWGFFAAPLLKSALKAVDSSPIEMKEAPRGVDIYTIRDILDSGRCICGTPIEEGSAERQALDALAAIVPPAQMGAELRNYRNACKAFIGSESTLVDDVRLNMGSICDADESIEAANARIAEIEEKLAGAKDLSRVEESFQTACRNLKDVENKIGCVNSQIGSAETSLRQSRTKRDSLVVNDETNRRVRRDRDYAERIYSAFSAEHSKIEGQTRRDLESAINSIFKEFFNGSLELSLDEKYNVRVRNQDDENASYDVETSEGQTVAVIFAFIAGVIRLATDSERNENEMLLSESYPLVMDAPLSKLDKKRIASVCSVMPKIAKQVVIMIKDTDGELAHQYLRDKVGYFYEVVPVIPNRKSVIESRSA